MIHNNFLDQQMKNVEAPLAIVIQLKTETAEKSTWSWSVQDLALVLHKMQNWRKKISLTI